MAIIIVRSRYDADGRMIVTFAGAEPSPIVASIVLSTVLIIIDPIAPANAKSDLSLKA